MYAKIYFYSYLVKAIVDRQYINRKVKNSKIGAKNKNLVEVNKMKTRGNHDIENPLKIQCIFDREMKIHGKFMWNIRGMST